MGRTLDIYVFSPRPLNDLLIEPNMPKLTLVVKTKKCQLSINDEVYAAAEKNRYEVTYKELPLLQGWNKISIAIGEMIRMNSVVVLGVITEMNSFLH